jgi:hypothetical protein
MFVPEPLQSFLIPYLQGAYTGVLISLLIIGVYYSFTDRDCGLFVLGFGFFGILDVWVLRNCIRLSTSIGIGKMSSIILFTFYLVIKIRKEFG